jgi:2-methylcitrate dehydratase PrpD
MKRDTTRPELLAAGEATLAIGSWAARLHYADLPPAVAAKAKECTLDALGCCLFGVTRSWTRMVLDMVLEQGGAPQASILGTPHRKGSPDFPMTDGERDGKFRRLAAAALPAPAVERIIREVESLEQAPDVRALVELMRAAQE